MTTRDRILATLRANRAPFAGVTPPPERYLAVTRPPESDLVARFAEEVEARHGQATLAASLDDAIDTVLRLIGDDDRVIGWPDFPLPGLAHALDTHSIRLMTPRARGEGRLAALLEAEPVRVGITGADAAFATTGTLVLAASATQGRLPSLLAPLHIALVPRARIFPRLEEWLVAEGQATLRGSNGVVLVTGPSSTGDIEQHHILGAHGPEDLHVVVF